MVGGWWLVVGGGNIDGGIGDNECMVLMFDTRENQS